MQNLESQTQSAVRDIRRLVYELRPPTLDDLGLIAALRESTNAHQQSGLRVTISVKPEPLPALPAAVEVATYRIAQEALTNVARHAQASRCTVQLELTARHLTLTVTDNGHGLPPAPPSGVGLTSMRERAEELGGSFSIEPLASGGTQVTAQLPLAVQ